jgi:hypothetical protein
VKQNANVVPILGFYVLRYEYILHHCMTNDPLQKFMLFFFDLKSYMAINTWILRLTKWEDVLNIIYSETIREQIGWNVSWVVL